MACKKESILEPILGNLDTRNQRGTGRFGDFELILNVDGSIETGYKRSMGWRRYLKDFECASGYNNSDLHDQMFMAQSVVDITPAITGIAVQPVIPWLYYNFNVTSDWFAVTYGMVYVRVSYESAGGNGEAEGSVNVTSLDTLIISIPMPGDAVNIRIIRLVGEFSGDINRTMVHAATGTGVVIEVSGEDCENFPSYEKSEITMLQSVTSSSKKRRLFAGTRETLFVNDDTAGNWRVIADGLGGDCIADPHDSSVRFQMETLGDIAIFTNGLDPIIGFNFNDQPAGANYWSADYVLDLQALRITSAKVIGKHQGFILIGDVVADGLLYPSRVYWCDYNNALGWVPGGESAAGFHDFGRGEVVLAMKPISTGVIRVYTSVAIYDGSVVNDDRIFAFEEVFRSNDGSGCLKYANSLVSSGDGHYYLGHDSVYSTTIWDRTPQRVGWMHAASGVIFKGLSEVVVEGFDGVSSFGPIDQSRCNQAVGGYDAVRKAVWFSWTPIGEETNTVSLVLWPPYQKASIVDHGFTAFANHRPDGMISVRNWMQSFGICPPTLLPKEGESCDFGYQIDEFPFLYNEGNDVSNPMDPRSVIASLCGTCLTGVCKECDSESRFLMASTGDDISLKEYDLECGYREVITQRISAPFPSTAEGCYEKEGFTSLLQSRLNRYGTAEDKEVGYVRLQVSAVPYEGIPTIMNVQVGVSDCPDSTYWSAIESRDACDAPEYVFNARPHDNMDFPFYEKGQFVTLRVFATGLGNCFDLGGIGIEIARCK
jgi:hypothetical protein